MAKRSLKQEEINYYKDYKELLNACPMLLFVVGLIIIFTGLCIAGIMMQAPTAHGHEVGLF